LGGLFVSAGVDEGLSALAMAVQNGSQLDKLRDSARYFILIGVIGGIGGMGGMFVLLGRFVLLCMLIFLR